MIVDAVDTFWKYVGEKPDICAADDLGRLAYPMTALFSYCKWKPLPNFFFSRLTAFVLKDSKLQSKEMYRTLADMAVRRFSGLTVYPEDLARWSERYLKCPLGEKPAYDAKAQEEYRQRRRDYGYSYRGGWRTSFYSQPRSPNAEYFEWMERRESAKDMAMPILDAVAEYLLRHMVHTDDFTIVQRHKVLEHMAGELYKRVWERLSGGSYIPSQQCERSVSCTFAQWQESVYEQMKEYLTNGARIFDRVCAFASYDFDAIKNFAGEELSQMVQILEATARAKIASQLNVALKQLEADNQTMVSGARLGMSRENDYTFSYNILKFKINLHVTDVGKGLLIKRKIASKTRDAAETAVGVGLVAAVVGTAVAFPPLLGLGVLGLAIFGGSRK